MYKFLYAITVIIFLASCGGGGSKPLPIINLVADPSSLVLGNTSTFSWSSTNANSCFASWTNQKSISGSEQVTINNLGFNNYSITCSGDGGVSSASVEVEAYRITKGVTVDGYISGAEVCIDENNSWTCNSDENSTTSDNDGKFTIRYENGNLISLGGIDLDSQTLLDNFLITHKLPGHSDFKVITPVTSTAAFMEDSSLINSVLGIDSSIDVFSFDPVANKGDDGINDYLYEKGNQLTALAYALQNITNNLNITTETTQDYFKGISEELEKEYAKTQIKVDIETESFITKVIDNIVSTKSLIIDDVSKANTSKVLAAIIPVIEVKSSSELTTSVMRFAISTLQKDIQAISNGSASIETIASYTKDVLNYIAQDQNVDAGELAPNITALTDSIETLEDTTILINVLLNDSYLTSAPISVTSENGSNGTTSVSNNLITYTPYSNYNGSDVFNYTITQGDKTSTADVSVTVKAVNDVPSIDIASTIQVPENQKAVTTISVSDVDGDDLTLTLGGVDSDSFELTTNNVLTFKVAADYETKTSYSITLSLTDGIETVTKNVTINITNVDEGIISWDYDINDGTADTPPILNSTIQFDASMDIDDVIVTLRQDVTLGSHGFTKIQHTKTNTNKWVGSFTFPENANPNISYYGTIFYKEGDNSTNFNGLVSAAITGNSKWTEIITSGNAVKLGIMDATSSSSYLNLKTFNNESYDSVAPEIQGYIDNEGNLINDAEDALIISGIDGDASTPINVSLTVQYNEDILYATVNMYLYVAGGTYTEYRDPEISINGNQVTINIALNSKAAIDGNRDLRLYIYGYDSGLNRNRTRTAYLDLASNSIGDANVPTLSSINFSASLRNDGRKLIDYKYVFSAEDNDLIEIGQTLKGPYCNFVYLRSHDYNIDATLASGTYSGSKLLAKNMPDGIYITQRTLTVHDSQYNKLSINRSDISSYSLAPIKFGESSDYCPDFKEDSYRGDIEIPENTSTSTVITTFKDEIKDPYGNFVSPEFSLGGLDGHIFNISEDGDITFKAVPDYENHLDSDNDSQYEVYVRVHSTAYPVSENPNLYISEGITIEVTNVQEWPNSAQVDFIDDANINGWNIEIPGNFQLPRITAITSDIPYTKIIISGQDADYFQFQNGTQEGTETNDLNFLIYRSDKSYECGRSFTFRITLTDGTNSVYDDVTIPLTCS